MLIVARGSSTRRSNTLSSNKWWQHLLLSSISLHLTHYVVMVLFIQISYFGETNLIARILVLKLIQVVLAPSYNVIGIIGAISGISTHAIVANTDEIGGGIGAISLVLRHVVSSLVGRIHVLPIMRVVLGLLLSVDESHSVDVVILMMIVLVSPHDELLLCPLQPDWSHRLSSITRDIDVSHILIVSMSCSEITVGHHLRQHLLLLNI